MTSSPAYQRILHEYNNRLKTDGRVNNKKFYEEIVSPAISNYSLQAWYQFVNRFKSEAGLIVAEVVSHNNGLEIKKDADAEVTKTLMTNQAATATLIQSTLNISADAARRILENPQLLTEKEKIEIGLKAMKAQDSRIHAIGKLREDNREQEKFDRAFSDSQFDG